MLSLVRMLLHGTDSSGNVLFARKQGQQCILLTPGHFPEPQQQLALGMAQAVHLLIVEHLARGLIRERRQIEQAMFEACDDFGVHAPVMLPRHCGDMFAHAIWKANDELVGGAAGVVLSCFHIGQH